MRAVRSVPASRPGGGGRSASSFPCRSGSSRAGCGCSVTSRSCQMAGFPRSATVRAMRDDVATLAPDSRDIATAAAALLDRELGSGLYRPEWLLEDAANPAAGGWLVRAPEPL